MGPQPRRGARRLGRAIAGPGGTGRGCRCAACLGLRGMAGPDLPACGVRRPTGRNRTDRGVGHPGVRAVGPATSACHDFGNFCPARCSRCSAGRERAGPGGADSLRGRVRARPRLARRRRPDTSYGAHESAEPGVDCSARSGVRAGVVPCGFDSRARSRIHGGAVACATCPPAGQTCADARTPRRLALDGGCAFPRRRGDTALHRRRVAGVVGSQSRRGRAESRPHPPRGPAGPPDRTPLTGGPL